MSVRNRNLMRRRLARRKREQSIFNALAYCAIRIFNGDNSLNDFKYVKWPKIHLGINTYYYGYTPIEINYDGRRRYMEINSSRPNIDLENEFANVIGKYLGLRTSVIQENVPPRHIFPITFPQG